MDSQLPAGLLASKRGAGIAVQQAGGKAYLLTGSGTDPKTFNSGALLPYLKL